MLRALLFALLLGQPSTAMNALGEGLCAPSRERREAAELAARQQSRADAEAVAALWPGLDLRGRCSLARAMASAGTRRAAELAIALAGQAEPEVFLALLEGLVEGGPRSLFAPLPEDLTGERRDAVTGLQVRWRVEHEIALLKSPASPTGHYTGQFGGVKALGRGVLPILFDIVQDRAVPLPGSAGAGPYEGIHPAMARFERKELRDLVAHGLGQVLDRDDEANIARLEELWRAYWRLPGDRNEFERERLASALAYSLHDLGVPGPSRAYIRHLEDLLRHGSYYDRLEAMWSLGYANIRIGNHEEGEAWYERILQMGDESVSRHVAAYNLACNFSLRAMQEPRHRAYFVRLALHYLEMAVDEFGWWDWQWMEEDGDLDFIRDQERYRKILEELRARWPDRRKGRVGKRPEDFLLPPPADGR